MVKKWKREKAMENSDVRPTKLDLGCGPKPREGFVGLDSIRFGNNIVCDLGKETWPIEDHSIQEANCSHFLEHLTNLNGAWERIHFFNELHRVLVKGGKCAIITPHWCSNRFYGDPTHKEPWSEMSFYYLNKDWRLANAPHADKGHTPHGYDCNFGFTYNYNIHADLGPRNDAYRQLAMTFFKEACQDLLGVVEAL